MTSCVKYGSVKNFKGEKIVLIPTYDDVKSAQVRISDYVFRTPVFQYLRLSEALQTDIWIKHENYQPIGSFKLRGSINLMSQMSSSDLNMGMITASSGNHGQALAYASKIFGARCVICVPNGANESKVSAIRAMGAEVKFVGEYYDQTAEFARCIAGSEGLYYVDAIQEPAMIAGAGTYTLEILEDIPDADVIIVPIGGGSGVCGACIAGKGIKKDLEIIAVQSSYAPAAFRSWKNKKILEAPMETIAEGLATSKGYQLPQRIMQDLLDDFVLVSDEEMSKAVSMYLDMSHTLAEHSGAASLAAAVKIKERLHGKKVVLVLSGGNISIEQLKKIME